MRNLAVVLMCNCCVTKHEQRLIVSRKPYNLISLEPLLVLLHAHFERLTLEVFRQPFKHMAPWLNIKPISIMIGKLSDKWEQSIAQGLTDDLSAIEKTTNRKSNDRDERVEKNLFVRN